NDEILTRWNLEKILTNRVRGIDSNPFLEEIWDDMACDSAFLFSHSLGLMISLTIFAIVLFFLNKK
ncbi:hypothetical protein ACTMRX_15215, partial [Enterococcus faecium]